MIECGVEILVWIKYDVQLQACRNMLRQREFEPALNELHWRLKLTLDDQARLDWAGVNIGKEVEEAMARLDPLHEPRLFSQRFITIGSLHYTEGV